MMKVPDMGPKKAKRLWEELEHHQHRGAAATRPPRAAYAI